MKKGYLLLLCLLFTRFAFAQQRIVVAHDGSGNFKTVQEAINSVPDKNKQEVVIFIKKGTYKEKLRLSVNKTHVTLLGEDRDETIITYDDFASKQDSTGKNIGTSGSSSFFVYGSDFTAINLTFQNAAGPVGQAVAVRVTGNHAYFQNCNFLGFQDTLYTEGYGSKQLYRDCYIEGTVDFIFGGATVYFERCSIFCKKGGGYVSAAATPDTSVYGYVFYRCKLSGNAPAHAFHLGRPWRPFAKTVYFECDLGDRIKPEGWQIWSNKDKLSTTYYAEYNDKADEPINRAAWAHQLTQTEAEQYDPRKVLNGWYPAEIKTSNSK